MKARGQTDITAMLAAWFVGLSIDETADVLGVSVDTVKRDWRMAKAWLFAELAGEGDTPR